MEVTVPENYMTVIREKTLTNGNGEGETQLVLHLASASIHEKSSKLNSCHLEFVINADANPIRPPKPTISVVNRHGTKEINTNG
jgi:hypothetical protein